MTVLQDSLQTEKGRRNCLLAAVRDFAAGRSLVPPLALEELRSYAAAVAAAGGFRRTDHELAAILLNNETWAETLAAVPFNRRILLLPQCLRPREVCPASVDEFGVLCEQCGQCAVGQLQREGEELGYVVLIAEGTTVVTRLLE